MVVPIGPTLGPKRSHRADTHTSLSDLPRPVLAGQRHFVDYLPAPLRRPFSPYKREAAGSTPTAPTRSEHMWIFKKIGSGLKVVPLVQPEVFDSGRASNARGILRAPEWQRVHRHQVPPALPRTVAGIGQPDSQPSPLSTQRLSPNLRLL